MLITSNLHRATMFALAAAIVFTGVGFSASTAKADETEEKTVTVKTTSTNSFTMASSEKYKVTKTGTSAKIQTSNKDVTAVKIVKKGNGRFQYVVTGKNAGTAKVKMTIDGKTTTYKVTVKMPKITPKSGSLYTGSSTTVKLNAAKNKVKWSSSDSSIVKVQKISNRKARLTAVSSGTAVIYAKVGKRYVKCTITVKDGKITTNSVTITDDEDGDETDDEAG